MSESLGRVEKPAAELFKDRRKLLSVFLLFEHESAPEEYKGKCSKYWQQVTEQLGHLEARLGLVRHVYHESIDESGDAGLATLATLYPSSHSVVQARCEAGAALEAFEDRELANELSDWERFLMLGFSSSKVASLARDMFATALQGRNKHAAGVIDSTLDQDGIGLLFVREGSGIQYPSDVEVFSVVPPALDEIHRWVRDASQRAAEVEQEATIVDDAEVADASEESE
ncbi:hypothetical protein ACFLUT_04375 [Chloroflexota bacterium]